MNDYVWDLYVIYCILTAVVALKMGHEAVKVPQYSEFTTRMCFFKSIHTHAHTYIHNNAE